MSGTVKAGAPWTRTALAWLATNYGEQLAQLEASIPDGHHVTLTTGRRPRPIGAVLMGPSGEVARVEPDYPTVTQAVSAVLVKAQKVAA